MSAFTTPADLRMLGDYQWQLLSEFEYHVGDYPSSNPSVNVICIPVGTITDLASVPQMLWAIFPPHGKYAKAAIVHDYLYDKAIGTKTQADLIFLEAMSVLGVAKWRRTVMYWAVRVFGRGNFPKKNIKRTLHGRTSN